MKSILTVLLLALTVSLLAQSAFIEVKAEPGISVFLDASFKGKTNSEMQGIFIENVSPGSHTIKVLKEGYNPQEESISVKPGEVYTYRVRPFIPTLKVTETGNTGEQEIDLKVGKLKIQSLPVSINIIIPLLGLNYNKSRDVWDATEVPVGSYAATFKGINKTLTYTFEIKHNQLTHLFVNMVSGKIENRSLQNSNYPEVSKSPTGNSNYSEVNRSPIFNSSVQYGRFKDLRDGKEYKTAQIGEQVWMAENLAYEPSSGIFWAYNNNFSYVTVFGCLYNWETAKKVCPTGWHLPNNSEWIKLKEQVGGYSVAGGKLKEAGNNLWLSPNTGATNSTGFTAIPGGLRWESSKTFAGIGSIGFWWSNTENNINNAWGIGMFFEVSDLQQTNLFIKEDGLSVRCLKD